MKLREVKKILNVSTMTVWRYVKAGKIHYTKINNNHYQYNEDDVYAIIGLKNKHKQQVIVSYSRVSTNSQKEQLYIQSQRIYEYCISKGIQLEKQYSDIKSGMNFERTQFLEMIQRIIKGEISLIVIQNKDRLCRFGFQLLENIFKYYNCKILVINDKLNNKSYEQEMTEDLVSIIHYFSMKMYSNRRKLNKLKKELLNK